MNPKQVAFSVVAVMGLALAAPTTASAVDTPYSVNGQCVASGPFAISGVTTDFTKMVPSIRRNLSVMGLIAFKSGCLPSLVCYASENTSPAKTKAKQLCSSVLRSLVLTKTKTARAAATKSIITKIVVGGGNVDTVYVTMTPGVPAAQ